jgi:hypothetical protein
MVARPETPTTLGKPKDGPQGAVADLLLALQEGRGYWGLGSAPGHDPVPCCGF